jgi:hypothetical protein
MRINFTSVLYCLIFLIPYQSNAQWSIPLPEVAGGDYALTDTIYMSPSGRDDWPGTPDKPVLSFQKALQLLPFGTPGVLSGHAYGLIRLLPGTYMSPTGMQQGENQWKKGNTFKDVSVEGIGEVTVVGDAGATGVIHGVRLMGDHFFVRNLTIRNFTGIGLFIQRPTLNPDEAGPSHIYVEGVTVDSTGSHGTLIVNSDIVHVSKSKVLRGSRLNYATQPQLSCTAWPSGLKFHFSRFITVEECEVAYTRGEGLNFHNCEYGIARKNRLHDNLTNLYNDNSARLSISQNYIFNTPGALQYACPCPQLLSQKRLSGTGILMGNEGSCADAGHSPSFQFCSTVQCGALLVPAYRFPTIDSVFVFNNIIHKCGEGIDFWQGNTDIVGPNCISNVFVFNNSIFEVSGDPEVQGAQVKFFFPVYNFLLNSYGRMKNIVFHGNVISYQKQLYPLVIPYREAFNNQVNHQLTFQHNVWAVPPSRLAALDKVSPGIAVNADLDDVGTLDPCTTLELIEDVPVLFPFLLTDFQGRTRTAGSTQAGALERTCIGSADVHKTEAAFSVRPNPSSDGQVTITSRKNCVLRWFRADGVCMYSIGMRAGETEADLSFLPVGMYFVSDGKTVVKWVKGM